MHASRGGQKAIARARDARDRRKRNFHGRSGRETARATSPIHINEGGSEGQVEDFRFVISLFFHRGTVKRRRLVVFFEVFKC